MGSNLDRAEGKKDIAKSSPSADSAGIRSAALEGWTHPEQIKQTVRDSEKVLKAAVSAISDSVPVVGLAAADQITKDLHGLSKGIADFVDQCKSNPLHVPEALDGRQLKLS